LVATDIFEDDFFMGLDNLQRLVWLGLIVRVADDQGRLQDNPALIRSMIFPADDVTTQEVETALVLCAQSHRIERYTAEDGKKLIQIINWWKYQTPAWAARSRYAAPEGWVDRIKMHTSGTNSVTKENWEHPGGYAVPFVDEIPGEGGEDVPTHVRTWVGTWVRTPVGRRLRTGIKLKLKLKLNNKNLKDSVPFDENGQRPAATPPGVRSTPTPSNDPEIEREVLQYWKEKFPSKPQPRAGTYRAQIVTRFKSVHFRENWRAALDRAAQSRTCQRESWFNFEFFIRNDKNYQKMLDRWMSWKDNQGAPVQAAPSKATVIANAFRE
jgi:hypothetical protein